VDDGSTDRTPEIVRKFQPHVRLIQKTNGAEPRSPSLPLVCPTHAVEVQERLIRFQTLPGCGRLSY
jgi:glycosyltransferase involved in cell wall biosynthesis